jgi:hypothetical protein
MRIVPLSLLLSAAACAGSFDAAPFARPCCAQDEHRWQTTFDYGQASSLARRPSGGWVYGLQWAEERDLLEVRVRYRQGAAPATLQYWNATWPPRPPSEHTLEDPADDPWQGRWIEPKVDLACEGPVCRYRFLPLAAGETRTSGYLAGVAYRRTLKVRLLYQGQAAPPVASVETLTTSGTKRFELRVRFDAAGETARFTAHNGRVTAVRPIPRGAVLTVAGAEPKPAGSNDITMVKVTRGRAAFSFAAADAEKGPLYLPDFQATVTRASDPTPAVRPRFSDERIRVRVAREPEQSYERASREIPPLDPVERSGGRLMLPLGAEASWQKFGYEWGGNVIVSKRGTKAKGNELRRLAWPDDQIAWRIGTGERPSFRDAAGDSTLAQLEDYLPLGIAHWKSDGLEYEQEAFATLLSGPLAPDDPGRSEQSPAVLMIRGRVRNGAESPRTAHLWLAMRPGEPLAFDRGLLTASTGRFTRAHLRLPPNGRSALERCRDGQAEAPALHVEAPVEARGEVEYTMAIPFIPELTGGEREQLAALDYARERARVVAHWREVTRDAAPFHVPEERFNTFAKGLVARIRISATKDPASGLYMIPAASYRYQVYANESAFQCQLLDVLGHAELAGQYLRTQVQLQGSKPLVGSYTGDQQGVYHGARVDAEYDYTAAPYSLNHGTVLWSLAEHYFMTRDRAWLGTVAASMKRAADWTVGQRQLTKATLPGGGRCAEYGLLPAGHLEDNADWGHWFSVNAYASAGLSALAEALRETGDPEAPRYAREAGAYREDLRAAVLRAAGDAPVTRLRDNTYVPFVPARANQRIRLMGPARVGFYSRYGTNVLPTYRLAATRELLYGPIILFDTGIFGVREPIARWVLDDWEDNATMSEPLGINPHGWVEEKDWFSRGGMVFQANLQNPARLYLRRGEIRAAIRSIYNNFVSCYYPSVNVFTEEYRRWGQPSGPFFKVADEARFVHRLRDLLVTESEGGLRLASGTPERWLEAGKEVRVSNAPTLYGPVSYTLTGARDEVQAAVTLPTRNRYREAWLHVRLAGSPPLAVTLDGKPWSHVEGDRIRLPRGGQPIRLVIRKRAGR